MPGGDPVDDVFQLVEQFLGSPDAEGGDQHAATVPQGPLDRRLETLAAGAAVVVQAVAVGAFEHQDVGPVGRLRRGQQGCVASAEVPGKDDPGVLAAQAVVEVALHIGGAEDVPGALQADAQARAGRVHQGEPVLVRQGDEALLDEFQVALQGATVAGDTETEGVFEDDGQQPGGRLAAENGPLEAGRQQVGNAPHVVDVHMGCHQRADGGDVKVDVRPGGAGLAVGRDFGTLEQTAVDQQAMRVVRDQLMAGAGDAVPGTMVEDSHCRSLTLRWVGGGRVAQAARVAHPGRVVGLRCANPTYSL